MERNDTADNVIRLSERLSADGRGGSKTGDRPSGPRVISITSGKGGVGKTSIVANLGYELGMLGKRVMILDADMGLGNIDILLGLAPKYNLSHFLAGEKKLAEVIVEGPGNMQILPAASGIQKLAELPRKDSLRILRELDRLMDSIDILLIDTAAGISSNVMDFNAIAHDIMVVVSPEVTSITDAYALMKVMSLNYAETHFNLVINSAASMRDARAVYRQLKMVTDRFLDISIQFQGYVLTDSNVSRGIRQQKAVCQLYPDSSASRCFHNLADRIACSPGRRKPEAGSHFFWKHLLED